MEGSGRDIRIFNRDTIKYAAVITMAAGHFIGNFPFIMQFASNEAERKNLAYIVIVIISIAVFAPPVFFFFIAEGYRYTRSRAKYALRLLALALVSQIPYCLSSQMTIFTPFLLKSWNIAATLFLGLICLFIWDSKMKLWLKIPLILLIDAFTLLIRSEWTIFGILMILGFHIFRERRTAGFIWYLSVVLAQQFVFIAYSGFDLSVIITKGYLVQTAALLLGYLAVTRLYNGEKGKHPVFSKWFFYIFYPAHLLAVYLLKCAR